MVLKLTGIGWQLAGFVMEKSDATRREIQATLSERAERSSKARGKMAGIQKVAAEETEAEIKISQVSQALLHTLESGEWVRRSGLRRGLRSDYRAYFDDALGALILTGAVEKRPTGNGQGEEIRKIG